jgi:ABC-type multidrug transport system fused ATPase/permease subunit
VIDPSQEDALVVKGAEFVWFGVEGGKTWKVGKGAGKKGGETGGEKDEKKHSGAVEKQKQKKEVAFRLADVSLNIPRGSLTALVGPVGCGTSSRPQFVIF